MTTSNRLQDIVDRIETQMRYPNGASPYNFDVDSVEQGFIGVDRANRFPHVCIPYATIGLEFTDRITSDQEILVHVLGYTKKERNPLRAALQLASDMENAVMADETLNGLVYNLTLSTEVSVFADTSFGAALMEIRATSCRTE